LGGDFAAPEGLQLCVFLFFVDIVIYGGVVAAPVQAQQARGKG
jgi:hypothetical protein